MEFARRILTRCFRPNKKLGEGLSERRGGAIELDAVNADRAWDLYITRCGVATNREKRIVFDVIFFVDFFVCLEIFEVRVSCGLNDLEAICASVDRSILAQDCCDVLFLSCSTCLGKTIPAELKYFVFT